MRKLVKNWINVAVEGCPNLVDSAQWLGLLGQGVENSVGGGEWASRGIGEW